MSCTFRKTRSDSFWVISHNSVMRQGRGYSTWQIEVDGRPCRDRNRSVKGGIDAAMYTNPDQDGHRPTFVRGVCYRTDRRSSITAGNHVVRWRQTYVRGDTYWGWRSNSRIMVEVCTWRRGLAPAQRWSCRASTCCATSFLFLFLCKPAVQSICSTHAAAHLALPLCRACRNGCRKRVPLKGDCAAVTGTVPSRAFAIWGCSLSNI